MNEIEEFIGLMKSGHAKKQIPIAEIPNCYGRIVENLRNNAMSAERLSDELLKKNSLRGVCPSCVAWADTVRLGMVEYVARMGKENVTMTNYGVTSRLLDGLCQRPECSSREIILIWKNDPSVESHLNNVIRKIEADKQKNEPIKQFLRDDVLAYTIDAIVTQKSQNKPAHVYAGKYFPDVTVWVSVLPSIRDPEILKQHMFPNGYTVFFDELIAMSGYDTKDTAILHWVYVAYSDVPVLHFSFMAAKSVIAAEVKQPGALAIPIDLLNKEEKTTLGLSQS